MSCLEAGIHLQTCDEETSMKDIKADLVVLEKVDESQILLVHAGQPLRDTDIPMVDLANFNRSEEIMIDLQVPSALCSVSCIAQLISLSAYEIMRCRSRCETQSTSSCPARWAGTSQFVRQSNFPPVSLRF